jgi:AcrR family transcriptional regulator
MGPDLRIATLNDARTRRSAEKRAAVEDAIKRLRDTRQAVTFVSVAREAKVSRQYLYNNFADEIGEERVETRAETEVIDGKKVPLRTPEEYRHIEAALRNKIERLETELRKAEHWRQLYAAVLARVSPGQVPAPLPSTGD